MIVRIMGEGQYRLSEEAVAHVNELDNAAVAAVEADDEDGFHTAFEELLEAIRTGGEHLGDEELEALRRHRPAGGHLVRRGRRGVHGRRPDPGLTQRSAPGERRPRSPSAIRSAGAQLSARPRAS